MQVWTVRSDCPARVYTAGDVSAMLNAVREVVTTAHAPAN